MSERAVPSTDGPLELTRALALDDETLVVAGSPQRDDPNAPFTRLLTFHRGEWSVHDLDFAVTAFTGTDLQSFAALGRTARLWTGTDGVSPIPGPEGERGFTLAMCEVSDTRYVCGSLARVDRQREGAWAAVETDATIPDRTGTIDDIEAMFANPASLSDPAAIARITRQVGETASPTFNAVAARDVSDLYVCGGAGGFRRLILHGDGATFRTVLDEDGDHVAMLTNILVDDDVWVCGQRGQLLRGNAGDGFAEDPAAEGVRDLLHAMTMHDGRLHIAGAETLWRHDGRSLIPFDPPVARRDRGTHAVQSAGEALWVVGTADILRARGGQWERIAFPGET